MSDTILTHHAQQRINQRLSLSSQDVIDILDNDLTVPIGLGYKESILHRLFYSEKDDSFFIAVEDKYTREIITILPLDYHNAFVVSPESKYMAKKALLESKRDRQFQPKEQEKQSGDQSPKVFRILCYTIDGKVRKLLSIPMEDYEGDMGKMLGDNKLKEALNQAAEQSPVALELERGFYVRLGKKGMLIGPFDWPRLNLE